MKAQVQWTAELDGQLRALREAGVTWDGVALAMQLGRNTVLERGRRIGARSPAPPVCAALEEAADRPARQAGHPETWGLLTEGTVLESTSYPHKVFL